MKWMSSPSISVMNCGIAGERLRRRELHALRRIPDRFPVRPPCCLYAPAQVGKLRFWNIHMKGTNSGLVAANLDFLGHDYPPVGLLRNLGTSRWQLKIADYTKLLRLSKEGLNVSYWPITTGRLFRADRR